MKLSKKCNAVTALALLAFAVTPSAALTSNVVLAQAAFPIPAPLPQGTTVKIDGSTSMKSINQALSDRFKTQFPGTQVNSGYGGSEASLQAVLDGKIDLAAIGRPLTAEELAKGLVAVPVARSKIAIFVGANNPFTQGLTGEQFASIFRGEAVEWSQVGGIDLPIRLIDRPDASDTRRALSSYPVFQAAPFQTGANALKVAEDSTEAVIQQLGNDGISYGIVEQVSNNPAVRVLPLYGTLPNDPRYPFSQPFSYVYKGANPSPAVQGFLGIATAPDSQAAVEAARIAAVTAGAIATAASPAAAPTAPPQLNAPSPAVSPGAALPSAASPGTASPSAVASSPSASASPGNLIADVEGDGLLSRWWWLLPALGGLGLLAWLLRDRPPADEISSGIRVEPGSREPIAPATVIPAASIPAASEDTFAPVLPVSSAVSSVPDSRIVLTPRNCKSAYAYWEVPEAHKTLLKQQGGQELTLRLYDVTDIDAYYQTPHSTQEFACSEASPDLHVPIPVDDRDYIAEIGYMTAEQRWLPLARSPHVRVPVCIPSDQKLSSPTETPLSFEAPPVDAVAPVVLNTAPADAPLVDAPSRETAHSRESIPSREVVAADPPPSNISAASESRLLLVPRSADEIYVYWEVSEERKQELRQQGGHRLVLRIYDITGVDLSDQPPKGLQQFECSETANDRHVSVPSYGDYIATLGYLTEEGRWLPVARSTPVRIRSANAPTNAPTPRQTPHDR
ncbi:MAG: DUF4912 domain-containing protein [Drouetiella hepatica Uher 2000/2452]|uniref:DUF4912 domain-containing protein n=1 Tax=Drouetiella hepatica Uher 2000/2452 TaxID=904376 RepID=A0A951Q6C9_9CYAN|nr:DUF4912 domain-containing protein [Drouetiella hepatica Uher 2000/2452]